jgi:hypothetical protein
LRIIRRHPALSPAGDYVQPADRLAEIRRRYGPDHVVTQFIDRAASKILTTASRVAVMLAPGDH